MTHIQVIAKNVGDAFSWHTVYVSSHDTSTVISVVIGQQAQL